MAMLGKIALLLYPKYGMASNPSLNRYMTCTRI